MKDTDQTSELVKAAMFLRWMKRDLDCSMEDGFAVPRGEIEEYQMIVDAVLTMIDDVVLARTKPILLEKLFPEK